MVQVVLRRLQVLLDLADLVVGLLAVVTRNTDKFQLGELLHVFKRHFTSQPHLEGFQTLIHGGISLLAALAPLDQLVEPVLDEDAFERGGVPCLAQLAQPDFQLQPQQRLGVLGRAAQDLRNPEEVRLLVPDDARVRGDRHLAVGEGVERVDGLVRRLVGRDLNDDFDLVGRIVVDLSDLDLALVVGLDDRILDRLGGRGIGNLGDGKRPFVDLRNLRPHLHRAAAKAVVIAAHVGHAARREIGVKLEITSLEVRNGGVDQLHEVVGQDFRSQSHGDAVGPLGQQQRELDGQRHRLLLAAVVRQHPLRRLLVEDHVEGEFRKTRLDITARGGLVAREDVAPVALTVDQQVLLPQLHQRVLDRRVAVRVVLHGLTHEVGDLVVTAVVDDLHRMKDTPLDGFQSVLDMRHGAFEDHVRGVVQEPVLIHARELADAALLLRQAVEFARLGRSLGHRRFVRRVVRGFGSRGVLVERFVAPRLIVLFRHEIGIFNF